MVSCEVIFGFKLKRRYFVFEQKKVYGSNNIIRVILMHNGFVHAYFFYFSFVVILFFLQPFFFLNDSSR